MDTFTQNNNQKPLTTRENTKSIKPPKTLKNAMKHFKTLKHIQTLLEDSEVLSQRNLAQSTMEAGKTGSLESILEHCRSQWTVAAAIGNAGQDCEKVRRGPVRHWSGTRRARPDVREAGALLKGEGCKGRFWGGFGWAYQTFTNKTLLREIPVARKTRLCAKRFLWEHVLLRK